MPTEGRTFTKKYRKNREAVLIRDGYRCRRCGKHLEGDDATVDHIIPWIHGGSDDEDNLVAMCRQHNSEKGANELVRDNDWDRTLLDYV
jgi:5-methylcytosine-specific restriction protein A